MKKTISTLAVTAIISSSVLTPYSMYTPNVAATEVIAPTNLVDNPNLISSDITINPNNDKQLFSWNSWYGYSKLKIEGNYAISSIDGRKSKIYDDHRIALDFKAGQNDTLGQTISTEIGKEYTFGLKFKVPKYMDRTIKLKAGKNSMVAFQESGVGEAVDILRYVTFTATESETRVYIEITGPATTQHDMFFYDISAAKSAKQVAADKKVVSDKAEASVKALFNNNDVKGTIKDATNQKAIDDARTLVNAVTDATKKAELEKNLKEAQEQLDARNVAEAAEKARQEAADASVKNLFNNNDVNGTIKDATNQTAIDDAKKLVDAVTDATKKAELEKNLKEAQEQLDARNVAEAAEKARQEAADASVKNLFNNNDVNGTIKDTTNQKAIDDAKKLVDAVTDPTKKAELENILKEAQDQLDARNAVAAEKAREEAAEKAVNELFINDTPASNTLKNTTDQKAIDDAKNLVNAIQDETKKAELLEKLDKAQDLLNEKNAEKARQEAAEAGLKDLFNGNDVNGKIKDTTNQEAIDKVQDLINKVTDPTIKADLQKDLDRAQELLDAKIAEELQAEDQGQQLIANFLVNQLFQDNDPATDEIKDITNQLAIDTAQSQIDLVKVSTVRDSLQKTLDRAQELLDARNKAAEKAAEKASEEAAKKAVDELFQGNNPSTGVIKETTDQGAIDAAQDLINKVTDPTIKKDLQKELDKAQDLLAEKVASEKAEKAREEAAKNAVDELFQGNNPSTGIIKETTDQSVIDAAQDLINKVTDPTIKKDLQKELDKAQDLLDIKNGPTSPEFIAAQEAIQDLLTTLVNFGQKTDVYGAVKLDTTQAKVYEAQDKLDLVPDKVVEKAELVAQLKKAQDLLIARNNEQIGNRVVNGNFDNALNGWKTWIGTGSSAPTVVAKDGVVNNAVKLASNSSIEQTIQGLKPNTNYVLTFYGKVDDKTFLSAGIKNHGGTQQSIRVTSADYSKGQIAFTTGANAKSATFFLLKSAGSGNGFADFVIAKADNGEDLIPEVIEATNTVDKLFTNLSVIGVNDSAATLYKNGALKITTKQAEIDAAKAIVDAMKDSYESKADLLATLKTAQDLWDIRSAADTGNLVKNGEFDNGIANWKPWNNATSTPPTTTQENGNNILKLATGSSTEQIITGLQPNTTYTLEVYGKVDNNGYVSVGVKNYGGAQKTARISGADYAKASVTIRTGATNKTATIFMMKGAGTGSGYIDDVRFQDSTPEGERPEVIAATEALAGLFTAQTTVSTTHLTPVLSDNGAIKMTTTDADLAAAAEKVAAVPADLAAKATLDAELARATTLFENLKASQTDNLAKNSQFDNNLTSWKTWKAATASTPVVVTENGNKVLKLEGNSSVEQTITGLLPNTTYTVSAYGKVEEGARLAVGVKSFGGSQTNAYVTSSDYAQGTLTFTTGATNTSAIIFLSQGSANGIAYADLVVAK
ncbi:toxin Cry1Ac domain D-VI-related protein [Listeria booriae]|uniref:toxin Cry1Ac domain D-VI-related protein n=1 Tax=Listeria booriae TaxID=1552123 RepID=UPI000DFCE396|nr:toxin Cry1Ac domain D-VI-related protein [Listeria booriae]STY40595.1 Carbohydrate binding domain [Listeria booriae]